ncbi:hypothetical protein WA026_017718 [Henosepilachna vigintioctopunctata]|uniref:Uncharacterized protein n=1 Tax=Henosepilachna vigintioctopunctata TaxID=420089 RepID=A0AAW1UBM1_9CUCU
MLLNVFLVALAIQFTECRSEKSSKEINPLFISEFISAGKIDEARKRSEVRHSLFFNKTSFSGYLTVNKAFNSNMFFWFFPSENKYEEAPVVLWLQGGPGDSTFISLFYENGPFTLTSELL